MRPPNLLFVFSDQHRAMDLGCAGNPQVSTPNLDRLAAWGLRFDRAISNSPLCVPARGSLLTGLFPWNHRALTNDLPVRPDANSIARVLGAGGWHTGYIGKWHLGGIPRTKAIPNGERLGFREWKAYNCNHRYSRGFYFDEGNLRHEMNDFSARVETDLAIDFMTRNRHQPWSLHLAWEPPHDPYRDAPEEHLARFRGEDLTLRPNVRFPAMRSRKDSVDEVAIRNNLAGYYAQISFLDEQFGRLMAALEATGQMENTLVIYTSDHGDLLGSHGLLNKQEPMAESVRVPLLMAGPGLAPGVRTGPVGVVDVPVTVASLLGQPWGSPCDGMDFSGYCRNPESPSADGVLIFDLVPVHQSAARGAREWMGIVTEDATWAMNADGSDRVAWDDRADPFQLKNLSASGDFSEKRKRLRDLTESKLRAHGYRFRPWDRMIREDGFLDGWNESQAHFNLPRLAPDGSNIREAPETR